METVTETITKTEDGDLSDLSDQTLRDLCLANHEARCHTLLYVVMTNTNGHQVSGHVDLADRVAKVSKCRSDMVNISYCLADLLEGGDQRQKLDSS